MLPYIDAPSLGPFNAFGLLAVFGVGFAQAATFRHAERLRLDTAKVYKMAAYCGMFGLLGAHFFDLFLYQPGWSSKENAFWLFINPFAGISSWGGLIGGTLGFVAFAHVHGIRKLQFADAAVVGVVTLLMFGRAGCAAVHDHVGVASDFALAVDFPQANPQGVVGGYHDLGLYDFLLFSGLVALASILNRRPRRPGLLLGVVTIAYTVPRFLFEFLRRPSSDPRYYQLTPAQWSCIAAFIAGVVVLAFVALRKETPPNDHGRPTPWRPLLRQLLFSRHPSASAKRAA